MNAAIEYLASPYLLDFWWALGFLIIGAYALAFLLSRVLPTQPFTVVYRCRQAWAISIGVHALLVLGIYISWYFRYASAGLFPGFWGFSAPYLSLIVLDGLIAIPLALGLGKYEQY